MKHRTRYAGLFATWEFPQTLELYRKRPGVQVSTEECENRTPGCFRYSRLKEAGLALGCYGA